MYHIDLGCVDGLDAFTAAVRQPMILFPPVLLELNVSSAKPSSIIHHPVILDFHHSCWLLAC